jgi:hypothetical protein
MGPDGTGIRPRQSQLSIRQRANTARKHGEALLMLEALADLWGFMRTRKKLWLAPFVGVLLIVGILVILSEYTAVAPFIYTLF